MSDTIDAIRVHIISVAHPTQGGMKRECVTPVHFLRHSKGETPKTGGQSPEEAGPILYRPLVSPHGFTRDSPPSTVPFFLQPQCLRPNSTSFSLGQLLHPFFTYLSPYSLSRTMSREERKCKVSKEGAGEGCSYSQKRRLEKIILKSSPCS